MPGKASSSESAKKGFAYRPAASKKAAAAAASSGKVVSFDEVDAKTPTVPRVKRIATKAKAAAVRSTPPLPPSPEAVERSQSKKRPASARTASPKKAATPKRPEPAASSQGKKAKTTSRYPTIEMDAEQYRGSAGKSHKQTLVQIVKNVCSVELEGLKRHFESQDDKAEVFKSLRAVLEELPKLVNEEVEDSVTYKPERQMHDAKAMREYDDAIRQLTDQQERLQQLVGSLEECAEQFDMMLQAPENEENVTPSTQTGEAVDQFKSQLDRMVQSVQSLKEEASSISDVMTRAFEVQTTLYDTFNATARFEGVHRSSTKDTIRHLAQTS